MTEKELTPEEAAQQTGYYSTGHIRWLAREGKVKSRRVGRRLLLINIASLEEYVTEMKKLGTQKHTSR